MIGDLELYIAKIAGSVELTRIDALNALILIVSYRDLTWYRNETIRSTQVEYHLYVFSVNMARRDTAAVARQLCTRVRYVPKT